MKASAFAVLGLCFSATITVGGDEILRIQGPRLRPPQRIDLGTALRLGGANNLDVQIARERLAEAEANHLIAVEQFFPYVTPGLSYKRHEGNIQTVEGH